MAKTIVLNFREKRFEMTSENNSAKISTKNEFEMKNFFVSKDFFTDVSRRISKSTAKTIQINVLKRIEKRFLPAERR